MRFEGGDLKVEETAALTTPQADQILDHVHRPDGHRRGMDGQAVGQDLGGRTLCRIDRQLGRVCQGRRSRNDRPKSQVVVHPAGGTLQHQSVRQLHRLKVEAAGMDGKTLLNERAAFKNGGHGHWERIWLMDDGQSSFLFTELLNPQDQSQQRHDADGVRNHAGIHDRPQRPPVRGIWPHHPLLFVDKFVG